MEKKKFTLHVDVDKFAPASAEDKEYLVKMRPSSTFFKDGIKRLLKNKKVFEENYIHMDALPRTAMARQYQFKYFGNDSYDNNDKNDSFSRAP